VERVWREYKEFIIVALLLLAFWVVHWVSVERVAEKRAHDLTEAYVRQRSLEDKALKTEERLAAMSRLGIVSQLSAIFAHEMGTTKL